MENIIECCNRGVFPTMKSSIFPMKSPQFWFQDGPSWPARVLQHIPQQVPAPSHTAIPTAPADSWHGWIRLRPPWPCWKWCNTIRLMFKLIYWHKWTQISVSSGFLMDHILWQKNNVWCSLLVRDGMIREFSSRHSRSVYASLVVSILQLLQCVGSQMKSTHHMTVSKIGDAATLGCP